MSLLKEKFASVFSFLLQIMQIKCFSVGLWQDSMVHKQVQMMQQLLCEELSLLVPLTKRHKQNAIRGCEMLQSTLRPDWTADCLERTDNTIWTGEKDKHYQNGINHLDRMTDKTVQSRLYIINQKDFKIKTDIGMRVLSQNRPYCLNFEVQVTYSVMLYTDVTRAVCVFKMSLVFTLHYEYNVICTCKTNAAFPAPVFTKCWTYYLWISCSKFHSNGITVKKYRQKLCHSCKWSVDFTASVIIEVSHSKLWTYPLPNFIKIGGTLFFFYFLT